MKRTMALILILAFGVLNPAFACENVCKNFKIGDVVFYNGTCPGIREEFIGIVAKIEDKPTNENTHWITARNEAGRERIYDEKYLESFGKRKEE